MDDVEPDVRAPLPRLAAVLDEGVQKHCRGEGIIQTRADEVCLVVAVAKTDVVMRKIHRGVEVIIQAHRLVNRISVFISGIERTEADSK